jgi:hypothetical protein
VQAGFILTAGVSLLWTAQMAHVLHLYLPLGPLCSRMLALAGVPFLASFVIDAHHRTCFLLAATCSAAGSSKAASSCSTAHMVPPLGVSSAPGSQSVGSSAISKLAASASDDIPPPAGGKESGDSLSAQDYEHKPSSPHAPPSGHVLPAPGIRRQALQAVLRGTFHASSQEQQYQRYLKAATATLDRTVGVMQILLLASAAAKGGALHSCLSVGHVLAHIWLHLQLRGGRRAAANRALALGLMMALHSLHIGVYNVWAEAPADLVEIYWRRTWIPLVFMGLLQFAASQVQPTLLPKDPGSQLQCC